MKTEYLLHREVGHVLAALTPQNRLVCEVMLHTGLRVGDVLALRTQQLASRMWVTERKTGKRKQVGLPGDLLGRVLAQAGKEWAFPGRRGDKPRTRQAVWADVKRAARAFRLPQNAGTHSMRKVYAVDLLERYGDIQRVRRALNHDRLETTLIYAMADRVLMAKSGGGGKVESVV
jgi:integrase